MTPHKPCRFCGAPIATQCESPLARSGGMCRVCCEKYVKIVQAVQEMVNKVSKLEHQP